LKLKPANVQVTSRKLENGNTVFTLTTDVFAKDVGFPNVPAALSDNFFDLCAGETREIVLSGSLPEGTVAVPICLNQVKTISYV